MKTLIIFSIAFLAVYYIIVVIELFSEKYSDSYIKTKKDLLLALIPFQIFIKAIYLAIKELN